MKDLDPNVLIPLLGFVASWLYHKIKGDKTQSIRELLDSVVTQVIYSPGVDLDNVRSRAEARILELLARKNVKGKLAEALVHEFTEFAVAELHKRFDLINRQFQDNAAKAVENGEKLLEAFETKPYPRLGPDE